MLFYDLCKALIGARFLTHSIRLIVLPVADEIPLGTKTIVHFG